MSPNNKSKKNAPKSNVLKPVRSGNFSASQNASKSENSSTKSFDNSKINPTADALIQHDANSLNKNAHLEGSQPAVNIIKTDLEQKVAGSCNQALPAGQKAVPASYASVVAAESSKKHPAQNSDKGAVKNASWLDISKHNRVLNDVAKLEEDRSGISQFGVTLEEEDLFDEEEEKRCLIGLFSGASPSRDQINLMVNEWKHYCQFHFHNSGWIVFEFEDEKAALDVLAARPYYAANKPITMKQMPKLFNFSLSACSIVPVWIQLPNLPFRCWKKKSLNKICSFIGKPISTDQITNKKVTKSFARCLLDLDLSKELPKIMKVSSLGLTFDQFILYEQLPDYCSKCNRVGHTSEACNSLSNDGCPPLYVPAPKINVEFTTFTSKNARRRHNKRSKKQAEWKPVSNEKVPTDAGKNMHTNSCATKPCEAANSATSETANSASVSASLRAPPIDAPQQAAKAPTAANKNENNAPGKHAKSNIFKKDDLPPPSLVQGANRFSLLANKNGPTSDLHETASATPAGATSAPGNAPKGICNEAHTKEQGRAPKTARQFMEELMAAPAPVRDLFVKQIREEHTKTTSSND